MNLSYQVSLVASLDGLQNATLKGDWKRSFSRLNTLFDLFKSKTKIFRHLAKCLQKGLWHRERRITFSHAFLQSLEEMIFRAPLPAYEFESLIKVIIIFDKSLEFFNSLIENITSIDKDRPEGGRHKAGRWKEIQLKKTFEQNPNLKFQSIFTEILKLSK